MIGTIAGIGSDNGFDESLGTAKKLFRGGGGYVVENCMPRWLKF